MELGNTTCTFVCPSFAHLHESVAREKGLIGVATRTTIELEQVRLFVRMYE